MSSTCAPTLRPTSSSSTNGSIGNPNDFCASTTVSNGVPCSTACIASPSSLASTRLTTNPGASLVMTAFLRSFAAVTIAVTERDVVGLRRLHDLDQRHDRDRVEEVEADEALGVLQLRADLVDRQRRGVGREDRVVGDVLLDLGEDLLLDAELLEHGLDDPVAVGEVGLVGRAGARAPSGGSPHRSRCGPCRAARRSRRGSSRRPCRRAPDRGR